MAKEEKPITGRLVGRQIFNDPTSNGVIQSRIVLRMLEFLDKGEFSDDEKQNIINFARHLALKLVAVWQHRERFGKEEDRLIEEGKKAPIVQGAKEPAYIRNSQELYLEFDEFLVQVKSTLDYLVKAPALVLGANRWQLHTFSSRGEGVIRSLNGQTPASFRAAKDSLIQFIENAQESWLEVTVDARDRINHFQRGGIDPDIFAVVVVRDGDEVHIKTPIWSTPQSVREMMNFVWIGLLQFVERFFFSVLRHRLPSEYGVLMGVNHDPEDPTSPVEIMLVEEAERKFGVVS